MGIDVLGSLNAAEQSTLGTIQNALPTWAGGSVLTPYQQAQINATNAQALIQAATDPVTGQVNTQLLSQMLPASTADTAAIAQQAQTAAAASDTSLISSTLNSLGISSLTGTGISSTIQTVLILAALAAGGYLLYKIAK